MVRVTAFPLTVQVTLLRVLVIVRVTALPLTVQVTSLRVLYGIDRAGDHTVHVMDSSETDSTKEVSPFVPRLSFFHAPLPPPSHCIG